MRRLKASNSVSDCWIDSRLRHPHGEWEMGDGHFPLSSENVLTCVQTPHCRSHERRDFSAYRTRYPLPLISTFTAERKINRKSSPARANDPSEDATEGAN